MGNLFNPEGFTIGLLAIFNACSFVLLPSYLTLFLNLKSDKHSSTIHTLNRAQLVSASMSGGFMTVLFVVGIAFTGASSFLNPLIPYISIIMGIALLVLGIAMLRGYELNIKLPEIGGRKSNDGSLLGMYIFGISYAVASLGCAAPLFFLLIGTSTSTGSTLGSFLSYGFGMGLSVTIVTLTVAFGKQSLISSFRNIIPKLNKISAISLLIVGPYVIWFGIYNVLLIKNAAKYTSYGGPIKTVESFNNTIKFWLETNIRPISFIDQPRYVFFAFIFVLINLGLIAAGFFQRNASTSLDQTSDSDVASPV